MLYPVCPTCGRLLADIEVEFTEKYNKLTHNDKKVGGSKKEVEDKTDKDVEKLFNEYHIKKYCCKMRLISYFDHVKYII
jgi:DNA-directed RNA polymerase subunit N (RpoN/RPB10)